MNIDFSLIARNHNWEVSCSIFQIRLIWSLVLGAQTNINRCLSIERAASNGYIIDVRLAFIHWDIACAFIGRTTTLGYLKGSLSAAVSNKFTVFKLNNRALYTNQIEVNCIVASNTSVGASCAIFNLTVLHLEDTSISSIDTLAGEVLNHTVLEGQINITCAVCLGSVVVVMQTKTSVLQSHVLYSYRNWLVVRSQRNPLLKDSGLTLLGSTLEGNVLINCEFFADGAIT